MNIDDIDLWERIIAALNGSCDSIEQALIEHNAEHLQYYMPFLQHLDNSIFLCDSCGWWCELSECADDHHGMVCDHCYEYEDDDQ
jgi:hypothetical protein